MDLTKTIIKAVMKGLVVLAFLLHIIPQAIAEPIPADEKNLFTLIEATHTDLMFLGVLRGVATEHTLRGTGTYGADGWTWSMSDSLRGVPLNFTYVGIFNSVNNMGTWNGTGVYGAESWHTSGSAFFLSDNQATLNLGGLLGDPDEWSVTLRAIFDGNNWNLSIEGSYKRDFDDDRTSITATERLAFGPVRPRTSYEKEMELTESPQR